MIWLGTSGFSYADWTGRFYPAGLPARDRLSFYARYFSACEINSTYYAIPPALTLERMVIKSGARVRFVVKAHRSLTHTQNATTNERQAFQNALEPLWRAGVLGCVLAQFPFSFHNNQSNREYLLQLVSGWDPVFQWVFEFRHHSWLDSTVYDFLRSQQIGWVNLDEPPVEGLIKPTCEVTGPVGYVRFHGRNQEKWFKRGAQPWERYDYLYSERELADWVPCIRKLHDLCGTVFVFFNNHWQSQAVTNARMLAQLLGMPGPTEASQSPLPFDRDSR